VLLLCAGVAGHIVWVRKGAAKRASQLSFLFLFNGIVHENNAFKPVRKEWKF